MSEYQVWWTDKRGARCGRTFESDIDGQARLQDFLCRLQCDARIARHGENVGYKQAGKWWYVNGLDQLVEGGTTASKPRAPRRPASPIKHDRRQVDMVNTSRYPDIELTLLIELARGTKEHGHVALNVKNSQHAFRGRAYSSMPDMSSRRDGGSDRFLVVAAIGAPEKFPLTQHKYPGMKRVPRYDVRTWQEGFVALVAHELTHCQQFALGTTRSEIEAEHAAVRAIEAYRKAT